MTQINFDPNKPATGQRFRSEEVRENFQALSRANDLRCSEQDPPDLTIRVESGTYAITSNETKFFAGGDSDPVDTTTGGSTDQQRIIVLELDAAGILQFNTSGAWVTPPTVPAAPNYTSDRIPLCEITITFGDTEITNSQITDVRPMINLGATGATGGLVSPGKVTQLADENGPLGLGPGNGQTDFKTTSSFTYFPGLNELLVFSGGVYQTCVEDYLEIDSETIRFLTARPDGERITIWKVGLSATPGSIGLADLSDVDGNEAAAFNNADSPTAINPFLTRSGHDAIDHSTLPSLAPFAAHLVTVATNAIYRHHASEIETTDNFTFTNATDVQGVLDDIETNVYLEFLDEHNADGTHGPKVSITQPNADNALIIVQDGAAAALDITKNDVGANNLMTLRNAAGSGRCISIVNSSVGNAILINHDNTGANAALQINTLDTTDAAGYNAINITHSRVGSNAVFIQTPNFGYRAHVTGSTKSGWGFNADIDHPAADGLVIRHDSTSDGKSILVVHSGNPTEVVKITVTNSSASHPTAIVVDQSGDAPGLHVNKPINGPEPGIKIQTNATGVPSDIEGTNANWSVLPTGTFQGANVRVGGGSGVGSGFLILVPKNATPTFPCDSVNGRDTSIAVTGSWTKITTLSFHNAAHTVADISRIETSGIEDGTIVLFTWGDRGVSGNTAEPRFVDNNSADNVCVTGNLAMSISSYSLLESTSAKNNITFMKEGSGWIQITGALVNIT
jgi:hypothetical protein